VSPKFKTRRVVVVALSAAAIGGVSAPSAALAAEGQASASPLALVPSTIKVIDALLRGDTQARIEAQVQAREALLGSTESNGLVTSLANSLRGILRGNSTEARAGLETALSYLNSQARQDVLDELGQAVQALLAADRAALNKHLNAALTAATGMTGQAEPNSIAGALVELVDELTGGAGRIDSLEDVLQATLGYVPAAPGTESAPAGRLMVRSRTLNVREGSPRAELIVSCVGQGRCAGRVFITRKVNGVITRVATSAPLVLAPGTRHHTRVWVSQATRKSALASRKGVKLRAVGVANGGIARRSLRAR
jgi:hypothetical protein